MLQAKPGRSGKQEQEQKFTKPGDRLLAEPCIYPSLSLDMAFFISLFSSPLSSMRVIHMLTCTYRAEKEGLQEVGSSSLPVNLF